MSMRAQLVGPNKQEVEKWCAALRSGEYSQCREALQDAAGYCCLGVACKLFIPQDKQKIRSLKNNLILSGKYPDDQRAAPIWLKDVNELFQITMGSGLDELNDDGFTFDEIADCLEAVFVHRVLEE